MILDPIGPPLLGPIKTPYSNYDGADYRDNHCWFTNQHEIKLKDFRSKSLKEPVVDNLILFVPYSDWVYYADNEHNKKAALARLMEKREGEEELIINDFKFIRESPLLHNFINKLNEVYNKKISINNGCIYFPAPRAGATYTFHTCIHEKDYYRFEINNDIPLSEDIKNLYDLDQSYNRSMVTTFYELQQYLLSTNYAKGLMKFLGYAADVILNGAETVENVVHSGYRYLGDYDLMKFMAMLPTPKSRLYLSWIKELADVEKVRAPVVWDLQLKIEPAKFGKFPRLYAKKDRLVLRDRIVPDLLKFLDNEETIFTHKDFSVIVKFCPANSLEGEDRSSHRRAIEWCMGVEHNQLRLVNFSDDVIYAYCDEKGNLSFGEGDVSKADSSIRFPTLFIMYSRIARLLDEEIAFDLISPLFAPAQLSSDDGRRVTLRPIFGYLYSGHCLTTALNNLNVKKGVCGIIEEIRATGHVVTISETIINGFRRAGIVIKVEPKTSLSELTFLKISVINGHSFTNLGPLFRKLGRFQDGLSHTAFNLTKKEYDKLSPSDLLELHLKTVVSSFQHEPHSPLHNALRIRVGLEPMETLIQYEHLSERYRQVSLSDWISLESTLHTLQVGHVYHSSAVKNILSVDYGNIPCKG